jgi:hypothetical protein
MVEHIDRKEVQVFRPKHAVVLATAVTALVLGGAGVALAAGGDDDSAGGTETTTTEQQHQSGSSHDCDHDEDNSDA